MIQIIFQLAIYFLMVMVWVFDNIQFHQDSGHLLDSHLKTNELKD